MSISANNKVLWSDLTDTYTTMNSGRTKHGLSTVTVPSSGAGTKTTVTQISDLNTFIKAMNSETHLAGKMTGITNPTAGTALNASFLATLASQARTAVDTCHHCSHNSFDSFGDCSDEGGFCSFFDFSYDSFSACFNYGFAR